MKNKKQKLKNLHIILDSVLRDMNENANKLSLAEEFIDEIYGIKTQKQFQKKKTYEYKTHTNHLSAIT